MTVTEFLLLHTTPGTNINFSSRVNVLFNTVGGSDEGIIEAITVTAQAFSVDGQQDPTSTDISNILEQVEEISTARVGSSDTSVLLEFLANGIAKGIDFSQLLSSLDGIFAFALYDKYQKKV